MSRRNRRALLPLALALALAALAASCRDDSTAVSASASPAADPAAAGRWDGFVQELIEASLTENPGFAVSQGRHDLDGKIEDFSKKGCEASIARQRAAREQALGFDAASLGELRRFERDYVVAYLEGSLFWAERMREHERSPLLYADAIDPSVYLTREYAPLEQRLAAYIAHAREIPRVVAQMKENLATPLPRAFVDLGLAVFGGLAPYLEKDVADLFAPVQSETLQAQLQEATGLAVGAVNEAITWFEAQSELATDDFALGPDRFREMLWATERVDTPLDQLQALGEKDMEQNLSALRAECEKIAPGKPLPECAAAVVADKPPQGPVEAARAQLDRLRRFIAENDLVTIPGPEQARVAEAPPYKRWNQAYIDIPGPFEKRVASIYYIAPPDPDWSEADRQAYIPGEADLLFISVHEVWPGHFLQFLHSNRVERMFGRLFVGYAFSEGWAHYSEEMMWDAGLYRGDPRVHVGQLLNALLRDARLLSSIGLHTRGMTVEQSEELFREKALQDPGNARQQAARGTFDPAYLNYTLGKLMIRKLRDDWTSSRGGRAAWHAFHDQLLSRGGPPIPLIRRAMLGDESAPL